MGEAINLNKILFKLKILKLFYNLQELLNSSSEALNEKIQLLIYFLINKNNCYLRQSPFLSFYYLKFFVN
jgi:hypothetical protein